MHRPTEEEDEENDFDNDFHAENIDRQRLMTVRFNRILNDF